MNSLEYYSPFNNNYENDGDIALVPTKAIFTIKLNGICEIEIEHPYDKEGRWKHLSNDGVIKSPTPYSEGQLFGIYKIKKNMKKGLIIKARHIFFDLYKSTTEDIRAVNKTCKEALDILLEGTKFTGHSDIWTTNNCYFVKQNRVQAINGNDDNTIINRWGGELFLNNYDITVNQRIGDDYGVEILYGRNMLDLGLTDDKESIITRGKPVAFEGRRLPELYIDSPIINKYREINEAFIDMSDLKLKSDTSDGEDGFETEEELYSAMRERMSELYEGGLDKPTITGTVKVAPLENTEKYKYVSNLTNIGLGDTVTVHHKELDIDIKVRCVGYEWNILTKKYEDVTLGDYVKNYFEKQSDIGSRIDNILNKNGSVKSESLEGTINAIKTQFKAMRDVAQPQEVRAMLFEDKIKGSSTYGATAIGTMGLMIASERTPDDRDWNWRTFIGGGYAYADWLIGKLRTVLIENMDGSFSMDLNKPGGMIFKNYGKEAIRIQNNALDMFNWGKTGEYIGSLISLARNNDIDKPVVALINHTNSAVMVGYKDKNNLNNWIPYIDFDKFNKLGSGSPIRVHEDTSLLNHSVYFGPNNESEIYNSTTNFLCNGVKNGMLVFHKSTGKTIFHLEGVKAGFSDWQSGIYYALFKKNSFSLPGLFKNDDSNNVVAERDFKVNGNFACVGQKNRIVKTEHYGERLQNAMESTECWFIDYGEGKLINGKAVIKIDPIHLETINTDYPYKVRVWSDDGTRVWSRKTKRYKQYFIVEGEADCEFEYEIIAKQKDYEDVRLEEVIRDKEYYLNKRKNTDKGGMRSGAFKESHIRNKQGN